MFKTLYKVFFNNSVYNETIHPLCSLSKTYDWFYWNLYKSYQPSSGLVSNVISERVFTPGKKCVISHIGGNWNNISTSVTIFGKKKRKKKDQRQNLPSLAKTAAVRARSSRTRRVAMVVSEWSVSGQ